MDVDVSEMYEKSGYKKLAEEEGIILLDLKKEKKYGVKWKYGIIKLPMILKTAYYINVAKMKTHVQATVTLGLKNQKGLLDDEDKKKMHVLGLHRPISELALHVKPDLTIIDGILGMQGDGPIGGKPIKSNVLIVSEDVVSADATASRLMGINPEEVEHINTAYNLKIGDINPQIKGDNPNICTVKFSRANEKAFKFFKIVIWRNPYACSMCSDNLRSAIIRIIKSPKYWIRSFPKMFYYTFIRGLNFIVGLNSKGFKDCGKAQAVCVGKCTGNLAREGKAIFLEGCPPSEEEIINKLF